MYIYIYMYIYIHIGMYYIISYIYVYIYLQYPLLRLSLASQMVHFAFKERFVRAPRGAKGTPHLKSTNDAGALSPLTP